MKRIVASCPVKSPRPEICAGRLIVCCGFKLLDGEVARMMFRQMTIDRFAFDIELMLRTELKERGRDLLSAIAAQVRVTIAEGRADAIEGL